MKTLFVMPHLDDEVICCGGLLKQISDKAKQPIRYLSDINFNNGDEEKGLNIFNYTNNLSDSFDHVLERINDQSKYKLPDDIHFERYQDDSKENLFFYHPNKYSTTTINYNVVIDDARIVILCKGRNDENFNERFKVFKQFMNQLNFGYCVNDYYDLGLEKYKLSDIADFILDEIKEYKPHRVITSSEYDLHQDHVIVSKACKIASRNIVPELLEAFNPCTKIVQEHYFDTSLNIRNQFKYKIEMCKKYASEKINIDDIKTKEYFKTVWREL